MKVLLHELIQSCSFPNYSKLHNVLCLTLCISLAESQCLIAFTDNPFRCCHKTDLHLQQPPYNIISPTQNKSRITVVGDRMMHEQGEGQSTTVMEKEGREWSFVKATVQYTTLSQASFYYSFGNVYSLAHASLWESWTCQMCAEERDTTCSVEGKAIGIAMRVNLLTISEMTFIISLECQNSAALP